MNSIQTESVKYVFFTYHISELEGKMLTLVDASIPDREQRKALKDLVRQTVWNWAIANNSIPPEDTHNRVCLDVGGNPAQIHTVGNDRA